MKMLFLVIMLKIESYINQIKENRRKKMFNKKVDFIVFLQLKMQTLMEIL